MQLIGLELLFVVLWSSGFIGAKYGLLYAGPFTLLFVRYVLVTLLLGGWLYSRKQLHFTNSRAVARSAVIGILSHAVWLSAVLGALALGVSPWIVALITALQPMLTSVLSGPLLNEQVSPTQWLGMGMGLVGVVLVVATKTGIQEDAAIVGYILCCIATVSMTLATLYQRHINRDRQRKTMPVLSSLLVQAAASALVLYPLAHSTEKLNVQWSMPLFFALFWLVVVISIGSYGLMLMLLQYRSVARVSSLMYLSPPVTLVMGYLLFGDALAWIDTIGLGITAVGVTLVYRG